MKHRWFLPETPDVLGTLNRQAEVTVNGMTAFLLWAQGDAQQRRVLRDAEHAADAVRRELAQQLRRAFTTPVDAEDLFTLSERLDAVLNVSKNVVRDAEMMGIGPTQTTALMAQQAHEGVENLAIAIAALHGEPTKATNAADAATKNGRRMEKLYSQAGRELATTTDFHAAMLLREHLQGCLRVGERIELVADRIWYSVVKEQ
jgi:uncharacterized protein Yka (UPF0111/DUF47 family)